MKTPFLNQGCNLIGLVTYYFTGFSTFMLLFFCKKITNPGI